MKNKSLFTRTYLNNWIAFVGWQHAILLCVLIVSSAEAQTWGNSAGGSTSAAENRQLTARSGEAAGERPGQMATKAQKGVVSVDIINSDGRLYLLTLINRSDGQALTIRYSLDGGGIWTKEQQIPIPKGAGAQVSRGSDARISKIGNTLLVMWMSHVDGAPHGAGPMITMRSSDDGKTWAPSTIAADWPQGPHGFMSLTAERKLLHAAWLDSRDGKPAGPGSQGLRYALSTDEGASWSKNLTLDESACACCWTTMRSDEDGNVYILYRDKQPSDMAIGVIDAKQHNWTRLSTVGAFGWDFPGCPHIGGSLAFSGHGKSKEIHAIVGTRKKESMGIYHLRSMDGGRNWSAPVRLGDESATHADIAANKRSGIAAVWDMTDPEAGDGSLAIYGATSQLGAKWSDKMRLSAVGYSSSHPRIIATSKGFLAIWTEHAPDGELRLNMKKIKPSHSE